MPSSEAAVLSGSFRDRRRTSRFLRLFVLSALSVSLATLAVSVDRRIQSGQLLTRTPERAFIFFYSMGRILNEYPAEQLYDYDLQQKVENDVHPLSGRTYGPVTYPPFLGLIFQPLALLSFARAYLLWLALSGALYLTGVLLLARHFWPGATAKHWLACLLAAAYLPFVWIMVGGQVPTLAVLALALAIREDDRNRPFRSGLCLALCLYKPTFLLLLGPMLLIGRQVRILAGLTTGGFVLIALSTLTAGPAVWRGYFRLLFTFGSAAAGSHRFQDLPHYMDLSSLSSMLPYGRSPLGLALLAAVALLMLGALARAAYRHAAGQSEARSLIWALTITCTLVVNLYVPVYDSVLGAVAVITTAGILRRAPTLGNQLSFRILCALILIVSWVTIPIARTTGFQPLTLLYAALAVFQFTALTRLSASRVAHQYQIPNASPVHI